MFYKKSYGESKTDKCPFCGGRAYSVNAQGIPVCNAHKETEFEGDMKCTCGGWLDMKKGKYGVFFSCCECNKNYNLNAIIQNTSGSVEKAKEVKKLKVGHYGATTKDIIIRSDEVDFL